MTDKPADDKPVVDLFTRQAVDGSVVVQPAAVHVIDEESATRFRVMTIGRIGDASVAASNAYGEIKSDDARAPLDIFSDGGPAQATLSVNMATAPESKNKVDKWKMGVRDDDQLGVDAFGSNDLELPGRGNMTFHRAPEDERNLD